MNDNINLVHTLLREKAELQARLNLIPYDGTVEIKEVSSKKYLYIRKRILGKVKSTYVGIYSEELYLLLLKSVKEAKSIKKQIRLIENELAKLNFVQEELSNEVIKNIDLVRTNMKNIIYDQAILEGVSTTFPDTELILENGKVNNISVEDVLKIINLKHAWEFILDKDVILSNTSYFLSQHIAKLVNESLFVNGGKIRQIPVRIGGSEYIPPIPSEYDVKEKIDYIVNQNKEDIDKAIELALYVMRTQIFTDGNKRTAVILANHYLISKGKGLMVVPYSKVTEFKKMLVEFYDTHDNYRISNFLKNECWMKL